MRNKRNRQQKIIDALKGLNFATIDELSSELKISHSTMRRDLYELNKKNLVMCVNRGSYYLEEQFVDKKKETKENIPFFEEKLRIAEAAASLIREGDTLFMDGGTTNLQIADKIVELSNLTIVTNSLDVAYKFRNRRDLSVYICGGTAEDGSNIVGPLAEKMVSLFRAQICFLGTFGINAQKGITDPNLSAARMKNVMIENSSKVVLVSDHSKFGKIHAAFVCPVNYFDLVITDKLASESEINDLKSQGISVELV